MFYLNCKIVYAVENNERKYHPLENPKLFGGDMLGVKFDADRKAVASDYQLWPGGIIPFYIDQKSGISGKQKLFLF